MRMQCLPLSMPTSTFQQENIASTLPSIVPQACTTEVLNMPEKIEPSQQTLLCATDSQSSPMNSFSFVASVRANTDSLVNSSDRVAMVSSVLKQSMINPHISSQRPCELLQSNVFQSQNNSVLPLACFVSLRPDNFKNQIRAKSYFSVPDSMNYSAPAFNLWTSDSFTLEGGGFECATTTNSERKVSF